MKQIATLVPDIEALFEEGHSVSMGAEQDIGARVGAVISRALHTAGDQWAPRVRLSNVGKPCTRQLWYEVKGYEGEKLRPHTKLKFLFGNLIEELVLFLAEQSGHTVERKQERVEVDGIRGAIDAVIDGVLVDVKSTSPRGFEKFERGGLKYDDPFGYKAQIEGYRQGTGVDKAGFLAMDKQNGHLGLFLEPKSDYSVSSQIAKVKSAMGKDTPPERAFEPVPEGKSGNMKLGVACSYCPMKRHCYPGLRTFFYASGPVHLTKVVRVPNVQELQ